MVGELAKQADGAKAVMGDGMEEGTMFGPINNKMQFERVAGLVDDARKEGGTIVTGGKQMGPEDGYFCESSNRRAPATGATRSSDAERCCRQTSRPSSLTCRRATASSMRSSSDPCASALWPACLPFFLK